MSTKNAVGDAMNVTKIAQDSLSNVQSLLADIKEAASKASSGSLGTDEKIALGKSVTQLTKQIQTVVESTVFGGEKLFDGNYNKTWGIGVDKDSKLLELDINLKKDNSDIGIKDISTNNFDINKNASSFAGVAGLSLDDFDDIDETSLGIFASDKISATLTSLSSAINNVNLTASYVGGIDKRLQSSEDLLESQVLNYTAAISRIEDADIAKTQLDLVRQQFLQQAALFSLSQANMTPQNYLSLLR